MENRTSGDVPGAAVFMSVFAIKICFVVVGAEQDICIQFGYLPICSQTTFRSTGAFYDRFIMDVFNDEAMPENFHSIAEDVAADGLNDIFYEFQFVGSNAFPFLCEIYFSFLRSEESGTRASSISMRTESEETCFCSLFICLTTSLK